MRGRRRRRRQRQRRVRRVGRKELRLHDSYKKLQERPRLGLSFFWLCYGSPTLPIVGHHRAGKALHSRVKGTLRTISSLVVQ